MTLEELAGMLEKTGFPCAYDHFAEGESPEPPFICYLLPGSDNFSADGRVYFRISEVRIELYTDRKDPGAEALVETVLDDAGIFYNKCALRFTDGRGRRGGVLCSAGTASGICITVPGCQRGTGEFLCGRYCILCDQQQYGL